MNSNDQTVNDLRALDAGIHISGNVDGDVVLLFHSSLSTAGQWNALIQQLEADYLCIAVDSVSYGKAAMRDKLDGYQLADEVERAAQAIQHAGLLLDSPASIHLIGHSFGGAIALRFAAEYPLAIASLSVFEPVAFHLLDEENSGYQEVQQVEETVFKSELSVAAVRFYEYWNGEGNFAKLPIKIQDRFTRLMPIVTSDFYALMHCDKTLDDYQPFNFPKLLMFGEQTRDSAKQVVKALKGIWPDLKIESVSGGHMSPVITPDEVNPYILTFLKSL